jgi:lipopolysaccharide transport protein LptA
VSKAAENAAPAEVDNTPRGGAGGESPFSGLEFSSNHGPINIQSDSMSLDYKGNTVLFRGHVHVVQSGSELRSNTLQVKYGKDFHAVQEMVADGDVRMNQGTRWATSSHAVLNEANHTVVLTGAPVVHDTNDQITGTRITVYLQTGQSVVEGARAVIFPRASKTRDNEVSADHAQ